MSNFSDRFFPVPSLETRIQIFQMKNQFLIIASVNVNPTWCVLCQAWDIGHI